MLWQQQCLYLDLDSGSEPTGAEPDSETQLGVLRFRWWGGRGRGGGGGRGEGGALICFQAISVIAFEKNLTVNMENIVSSDNFAVWLTKGFINEVYEALLLPVHRLCRRRGMAPCRRQNPRSLHQTTLLQFLVSWDDLIFPAHF